MKFTFECRFKPCGAKFSLSFNLDKHESLCRYNRRYTQKINEACLRSLFPEHIVHRPSLDQDDHHTCMDYGLGNEYESSPNFPSKEEITIKELAPSSSWESNISRAADIIEQISRISSKHLTQELLSFLHESQLCSIEYKSELPTLNKCKTICNKKHE